MSDLERTYSRRRILEAGASAVAGLSAGALVGYGKESASNEEGKPFVVPEVTQRVSYIEPLWTYNLTDTARVALSQDGTPAAYVVGGESFQLNRRDIIDAMYKAKATQIPQLAGVKLIPPPFGAKIKKEKFVPTQEKPNTTKLPQDTLSVKQLSARNIEIIQSEGVQLFIRRTAFDFNGPLTTYASGNKKLQIVLLDGPNIAHELLDDDRYVNVRDRIENRFRDAPISAYRRVMQQEAQQTVFEQEQEFKRYTRGQIKLNFEDAHFKSLINAKIKKELYNTDLLSDSDLRKERAVPWSNYSGLYFELERSFIGDIRTKSRIYVGVGGLIHDSDVLAFFVTPDSQFAFTQIPAELRELNSSGISPNEYQTYLNADGIPKKANASPKDPKSYLYDTISPGWVLRHEFAHDEMIAGKDWPVGSEYYTDVTAWSHLKNATERWRSSGFKDNSGYCFVLKAQGKDFVLT